MCRFGTAMTDGKKGATAAIGGLGKVGVLLQGIAASRKSHGVMPRCPVVDVVATCAWALYTPASGKVIGRGLFVLLPQVMTLHGL